MSAPVPAAVPAAVPAIVEAQLARLVLALREVLDADLAGLYLHGSLAMGAFDPRHSDIDLLAVVHRALTATQRRNLVALLLEASGQPAPVEITVLTTADVRAMRHPLPYELHFSEAHRAAYADGSTHLDRRQDAGDPDVIAHALVARRRGRVLHGAPLAALFPMPGRAAVADAFTNDLTWAHERLHAAPAPAAARAATARYLALNAARAIAWAQDDVVLSKPEGAHVAGRFLPEHLAALVRTAAAGEIAASAELDALLQLALLYLGAVSETRRSA